MEALARQLIVAHVVHSGLGRGGYDDLAYLGVVLLHRLVRFGEAVGVDLDHPHVVVGACAPAASGMLGKVGRSQEGVPEGLGRAVAVEYLRGEHLHEAYAALLVEGSAHRHDALEAAQVGPALLLHAAEQIQDRRHADEEVYAIVLSVLQCEAGVELAHHDHLASDVEGGAGAAGMQASAVEPRSHVHGLVAVGHGEVHYYVMGGEHLVDGIEGHSLGPAGGAGGVEPRALVVDVQRLVGDWLPVRAPAQEIVEVRVSLGSGAAGGEYDLRAEGA